jgi:surface polysaccharide O-acyltransferase-like enzyme
MWCALLFLIFFTAIATYLVTFENGDLDEEFFKYQSPNIVLMSVLSFILISNLNLHHIIYLKIRDMVNKYSYGIYLLHALVLLVVEKLGLGWNFIHPLVGIPVGTLLTLSISFVIIFLLNKIPLLRRFAG